MVKNSKTIKNSKTTKNIKITKKSILLKIATLFTLTAVTMGLAACGKKADQKDQTPEKEFVWVAKSLPTEENRNYYNLAVAGNSYYVLNTEWSEDGAGATTVSEFSAEDGSSIRTITLQKTEAAGDAGDSEAQNDSGAQNDSETNSSRNISRFALDTEGNIITLDNLYHWSQGGDSSQEYFLVQYGSDGAVIWEKNITDVFSQEENDNLYLNNMSLDQENRIYLTSDQQIWLFEADGTFHGKVELSSWAQSLVSGKDGKVYLSYYNNGYVICGIDFEQSSLLKEIQGIPIGGSNNNMAAGFEKTLLVTSDSTVYEFDCETGEKETLFDWLDSDINGNTVDRMFALENGQLFVLSNDWENNLTELLVLTKTPAAEVAAREEIVMAVLYPDSRIQSAIVQYNKSNDQYHVTLRQYLNYDDITYGENSNYEQVIADSVSRLNNDLTSSNAPDILLTDGIAIDQYASKGVFEDLDPYLEQSTLLSREDFFESILEAGTKNGKLVCVPKSFQLVTLVGKKSVVGDREGWTMKDLMQLKEQYPDSDILRGGTKTDALSMLMKYSQSEFVDWETGKCSFDSEGFEQILEFANTFPEEYQYEEDGPSYPVLLQQGKILLDTGYIYDFNEIQFINAMFDNEAAFIGYPNNAGDSGTYFEMTGAMAIVEASSNKEGAWNFIEAYLTKEPGQYDEALYSNKKLYAERRKKATTPEYVTDENGKPMLDENGEPILQGYGSVGYGDDWMYEYRTTTEEEADLLEYLISVAKPSGNSNTEIMNIITEEAGAYFKGQKSAKDVASVIQSRVQVYVNENR